MSITIISRTAKKITILYLLGALNLYDTCSTSKAPNSTQRPFSGLYTCVPFMMTVCAGKFTPQANVAVDTRTCQTEK